MGKGRDRFAPTGAYHAACPLSLSKRVLYFGMATVTLNSFEMLSSARSFDPHRNLRNPQWKADGVGNVRVWGILKDDSTITEDQTRERVQTLNFDVVVPENSSVQDILTAIQQSLPTH